MVSRLYEVAVHMTMSVVVTAESPEEADKYALRNVREFLNEDAARDATETHVVKEILSCVHLPDSWEPDCNPYGNRMVDGKPVREDRTIEELIWLVPDSVTPDKQTSDMFATAEAAP